MTLGLLKSFRLFSKHFIGKSIKIAIVMESIGHFKKNVLKVKMVSLDLEETLIVLSISATVNPGAQMAVEKLKELPGCEVHMTHIPTPGDEAGLGELGVNVTSDPEFATKHLFGI
jgi:uncharacterized protein (UPF0371 family)